VTTSVVTERDVGEYGFACCWCGRQFVVGDRYVRVPLGGTVGVYEAVCVPCVAATGERVTDPTDRPSDDRGGPE
jgi:hypothetical protein